LPSQPSFLGAAPRVVHNMGGHFRFAIFGEISTKRVGGQEKIKASEVRRNGTHTIAHIATGHPLSLWCHTNLVAFAIITHDGPKSMSNRDRCHHKESGHRYCKELLQWRPSNCNYDPLRFLRTSVLFDQSIVLPKDTGVLAGNDNTLTFNPQLSPNFIHFDQFQIRTNADRLLGLRCGSGEGPIGNGKGPIIKTRLYIKTNVRNVFLLNPLFHKPQWSLSDQHGIGGIKVFVVRDFLSADWLAKFFDFHAFVFFKRSTTELMREERVRMLRAELRSWLVLK
jgi:hypothetical protein